MTQYRKKPVVIEAWQWDGHSTSNERPEWLRGPNVIADHSEETLDIQTLEGLMTASKGDWITRGVKGEIYPCKPDIFVATYEPATPLAASPAGGDGEVCPSCGSKDCYEEDGDHTFPVGDDFNKLTGLPAIVVNLTVRVPIGRCRACSFQWFDYRSEYVTEAAAKVWRETRREASEAAAKVVRDYMARSDILPVRIACERMLRSLTSEDAGARAKGG